MGKLRINKLELQEATNILKERIYSLDGVHRVRLHHRIREMETVAELVGKGALGPHFARNMNDIPPGHVMLIVAYDIDDNPIGMVGSRFDDKPGWDLKDFLAAHWSRLYPAEGEGQYAQFSPESCHYAEGLNGPFTYIGDGWIKEGHRGGSMLALIQRWLILLSYDEWKPELIYGWMRPDKVLAGYAARWGYSMVYPRGIEWRIPPKQKDLRDVYFVGVDTVGIHQMIRDLVCEG